MRDPVTQPSRRLGLVLRDWRKRRALTQMDLALAADTSARHISFVETGRAKPSPAMLVALVRALELPHHEASLILRLGAGQPAATGVLDGGADALALVLESQEPFAALAFDRLWNVVMVNRSYGRFINRQFPAQTVPVLEPMGVGALNLLRLVMSPRWLRPLIVNWTDVAAAILTRAGQAVFSSDDQARRGLAA
jgi:transcriptional regulator with XRE-family HTH domain